MAIWNASECHAAPTVVIGLLVHMARPKARRRLRTKAVTATYKVVVDVQARVLTAEGVRGVDSRRHGKVVDRPGRRVRPDAAVVRVVRVHQVQRSRNIVADAHVNNTAIFRHVCSSVDVPLVSERDATRLLAVLGVLSWYLRRRSYTFGKGGKEDGGLLRRTRPASRAE